jgi:hypothetical protein
MKFCIAALLLFACLRCAAADLTVAQFNDELERVSAAIERDPAAAARALPEYWEVVERGQRWRVPTARIDKEIQEELKGGPAGVKRVTDKLQAMRSALMEPAAPEISNTEARTKMEAVLGREEFRPPSESWLERWWDKITDAIARLWRRIFGFSIRISDVSNYFFWALMLAVSIAAITFLVRRWKAPRDASSPEIDAPLSPSRRAWLEFARRASEAARAGNYREAVRLSYWAGIYRMEELGQWRAERMRTHREYLGMLPRESPSHAPLAAITEQFERTWYAGAPAGETEFRSVSNRLEELGCRLETSHPAIENS